MLIYLTILCCVGIGGMGVDQPLIAPKGGLTNGTAEASDLNSFEHKLWSQIVLGSPATSSCDP